MEQVIFIFLGCIAIISALLVILQRNVLYSALFLIVTFVSLALIYALLDAPFIAAVQLIIYAGAIMILFIFVIMMINVEKEKEKDKIVFQKYIGLIIGIVLLLKIAGIFKNYLFEIKMPPLGINVIEFGKKLYTYYFIPFELISFLLLIAIIGVVILAKKR